MDKVMKRKVGTIINIIASTGSVGLINTLLIHPKDIGSWKNYLGYILLIAAVANLVWLLAILYKKKFSNSSNN